MKKFPNYKQADNKDCGPTCLKIVAKYYGKTINIQKLRDRSETTREGTNLLFLSEAAEKIGFKTLGIQVNLKMLEKSPFPCILHWNKNHYVVLYRIEKNAYFISDPAFGLIKYNAQEFIKSWIGNNADQNTADGIVLLIDTGVSFVSDDDGETPKEIKFGTLKHYIFKYRSFLIQLAIGLFASNTLQLIFPFLTQSIVDVGIQNQNISFIYLILFAQLFLFGARIGLELIRSWILLHLSTRLNISLISDFFIKLMNLPISFFDVRMTGDIMKRINDHDRIERILSTSSLNVLFSAFNMLIMGEVLAYYSIQIFSVFFLGSIFLFRMDCFIPKSKKNTQLQAVFSIRNRTGKSDGNDKRHAGNKAS